MRRLIALLCACSGLAAASAAADSTDILPFTHYDKTLANGLKVIVVPTGFPNIVSLQIPVQTGSRNEFEPGKTGFAHFFEHMMFRGTAAYPPDKYQAVIAQAGAHDNATTSDDYTHYFTTFAKQDLEKIIALNADRFQNLDYSEAAFKTESRAVLGEYNKNSTNPIRQLLEVQRDHAFTTHTYKHTTMGFLKDIENMPSQYAYSKIFFDRWYRPEYTTLIVAGDVQPEQVFALVEKYWSGWKHGSYTAQIPQEPPASGPVYAHVAWPQPSLPLVSVAFHSPAFSDTNGEWAAMNTLLDLKFGPTSELYKRLVQDEQRVDELFTYFPDSVDPELATVIARVKSPADAMYVRDAILKTFAEATRDTVDARRLADAKSNARYAVVRGLDDTEHIADLLSSFVHFDRSFDTVNNFYRLYARSTPDDLLAVARKYFTDANLVVTTLSRDSLPAGIEQAPTLASLAPAPSGDAQVPVIVQRSVLPQLDFKLLFTVGSAADPKGKEGLAALSAAMIAEAGSRSMRYDEIQQALFPMAGGFADQVDKEMTTFTGTIHRDNWKPYLDIVLPQLLDPGLREDDFKRLKDAQLNALQDDLKAGNDEELGKERLQNDVFAATPYGHTVLGTVAGIKAITLDDVKAFIRAHYTQTTLSIGESGDLPGEFSAHLLQEMANLPAGNAMPPVAVTGRMPAGREVDILAKDTRSTAVSFGYPIPVTRASPDFAALSVARSWLGEHRAQQGRLFDRIREQRGLNYGDYAYIEAFPRGMFQFMPDPNIARRAQLFEIWLRPVRSNLDAHMALRIAIHEIDQLVRNGMTRADFERTRSYLMKNVYLLTATQDEQLGYALDSKWYGIGEYTDYMRGQLQKLTLADVNRAVRKYLQTRNLSIVIVSGDAEDMKQRLVSDAPSILKYDGEKPAALLAEDQLIGHQKLGIRPDAVSITPLAEVFAR